MKSIKFLFIYLFLLMSAISFAQVGIGTTTPDPSSILDLSATDKGLLLPRITTVQRDAISAPAKGLMIYNITANEPQINIGTTIAPLWVTSTITGTAPINVTSGNVSLDNLGVTTAKLADAAVTTTKIASGGNSKVLVTDATGVVVWLDGNAFGAVADMTTIEGAGTITDPFKVKDLGIVTAKLADAAVTTAKIADANVTTTKIASGGNSKVLVTDATGVVVWLDANAFGAVADMTTIEGAGTITDPFKVKDLGIVTAKLADAAVTTAKIADANVTTTKIASGGNSKVLVTDATGVVVWLDANAFGAVADMTTIEGAGTLADPFKVKDLGIVTAKLADAAVTTAKIADANVTTTKIASGGNNKVLVTDATGTVVWLDANAFGAVADMTTIEGSGTITDPFKVKDLGIVTAKLADAAVTTAKIADANVTTTKIASGGNSKVLVTDATGVVVWLDANAFGAVADMTTIEGAGTITDPFKVKDLGIVTAKLADAAVTTAKIADANVTTAKIADANVTTTKIASGGNSKVLVTDATGVVQWLDANAFGAVADMTTIEGAGTITDPFKVKDLGIVTAKLADAAVTTAKIADANVTTTKIASGGNSKVLVTDATGVVVWLDANAFGAVADMTTIEGAGTITDPFKVKDLGIVTAKLADAAVTTAKIADANVTTTKIASGGNSKVLVTDATGVVVWLDANAFGAVADMTTIEGAGTITDPFKVKDLGIVTAKLADAAVTTAKIADANVTTAKIADANVTTTKIASGGNSKVLVTDATGVVVWLDANTFGAVADMTTIEGAGTITSPFRVKDLGIVTVKIANQAVTPIKMQPGANNTVLVTDNTGTVLWQTANSFAWGLTGNSGTNATTNFLGTTDNVDLIFRRANVVSGRIGTQSTSFGVNTGVGNSFAAFGANAGNGNSANNLTAFGNEALASSNSGASNTAVGSRALRVNTSGYRNTAVGEGSLVSNNTGFLNDAFGSGTLNANTSGSENVAFGASSLSGNTTGIRNTAVGSQSLAGNGDENTSIGYFSMRYITTGNRNTALGRSALQGTLPGLSGLNDNTAVGYNAMSNITGGTRNTAVGINSLFANGGSDNNAFGYQALQANGIGANNTAVGNYALLSNTSGGQNVAVGNNALRATTTGGNNVGVGHNALTANINGEGNNAIGRDAMLSNTSGYANNAVGYRALKFNTSGFNNTAFGDGALEFSTTASNNNAFGNAALASNTSGTANQAFGNGTLQNNTSGSNNTAMGTRAMEGNFSGNNNAGFGSGALFANTSGGFNAGFGPNALNGNTTGNNNIGIGFQALTNKSFGDNNIAIGLNAGRFLEVNNSLPMITANNSIFIGLDAYALNDNETNQIVFGNSARGLGSNTMVLGGPAITQSAIAGNVLIGTTTNVASSQLTVDSTTKGSMPFPTMTQAQRTAIVSPAAGLHVYQTDGTEGVYVYKSSGWAFAY
jgi:phosphopantothenoylcysteine synthetase/decarboxylase